MNPLGWVDAAKEGAWCARARHSDPASGDRAWDLRTSKFRKHRPALGPAAATRAKLCSDKHYNKISFGFWVESRFFSAAERKELRRKKVTMCLLVLEQNHSSNSFPLAVSSVSTPLPLGRSEHPLWVWKNAHVFLTQPTWVLPSMGSAFPSKTALSFFLGLLSLDSGSHSSFGRSDSHLPSVACSVSWHGLGTQSPPGADLPTWSSEFVLTTQIGPLPRLCSFLHSLKSSVSQTVSVCLYFFAWLVFYSLGHMCE